MLRRNCRNLPCSFCWIPFFIRSNILRFGLVHQENVYSYVYVFKNCTVHCFISVIKINKKLKRNKNIQQLLKYLHIPFANIILLRLRDRTTYTFFIKQNKRLQYFFFRPCMIKRNICFTVKVTSASTFFFFLWHSVNFTSSVPTDNAGNGL